MEVLLVEVSSDGGPPGGDIIWWRYHLVVVLLVEVSSGGGPPDGGIIWWRSS